MWPAILPQENTTGAGGTARRPLLVGTGGARCPAGLTSYWTAKIKSSWSVYEPATQEPALL